MSKLQHKPAAKLLAVLVFLLTVAIAIGSVCGIRIPRES